MTDPLADPLENAREHFQAGIRRYEASDFEGAARAFESALALSPGRPSVLLNLARTLLKLHWPQEALLRVDTLLTHEPDNIEALFHQGHALADLGRADEALAAYERVLHHAPDNQPGMFHRALMLGRLGRWADAIEAFRALAHADVRAAEPWWQIGQALQALDRDDEALAAYDEALARDPARADAWSCRGEILKDRGQFDEAARCFSEAMAHGGDAALNGYLLAAVTGQAAPPQAPSAYVKRLFDGYAEGFDEHLVQQLHYRAPQQLADQLRQIAPGRSFGAALDVGCGTGLCAPLLKPLCHAIDGVDLSASMLERARSLGLYRQLTLAEAADHLARTAERYELLVAADVFIYIGALEPVFAGAARVLRPRGILAFSAEAAPDDADFRLLPSSRYAHSRRYLEALAAAHGFSVASIFDATLREELRQPIRGYIVSLRRH